MHARRICSSLAVALLLVPLLAQAGSISLVGSRVDPDRSGYGSTTTLGVRADTVLARLGIAAVSGDLEASASTHPGTTASGRDWRFRSVGAYLTARTAGPVYLLGRVGIARQSLDVDGGNNVDGSQRGVGLGLGISAGVADLELMAMKYSGSDALGDVAEVNASLRF